METETSEDIRLSLVMNDYNVGPSSATNQPPEANQRPNSTTSIPTEVEDQQDNNQQDDDDYDQRCCGNIDRNSCCGKIIGFFEPPENSELRDCILYTSKIIFSIFSVPFLVGLPLSIFSSYQSYIKVSPDFSAIAISDFKQISMLLLIISCLLLFTYVIYFPIITRIMGTCGILSSFLMFFIFGSIYFVVAIIDIKFNNSCDKLKNQVLDNVVIFDDYYPILNNMLEKYKVKEVGINASVKSYIDDNCHIFHAYRGVGFGLAAPLVITLSIGPYILVLILIIFALFVVCFNC